MSNDKRIVCVIPARLQSSRFPRKMLAKLGDKPLVQWAYEGAKQCSIFSDVIVAVDHVELLDAVGNFGGKAIMTSPHLQSGTERLCALQAKNILEGDIWVNWQGDEPFITESVIQTLLQSIDNPEEEIWTLKRKLENVKEASSPHIVKVVTDHDGKALYFSRSLIPYDGTEIYKHVGLYAYRESALQKISKLSACPLEAQEKLEQLRFLYHGISMQVHETSEEIFGIDTKEELAIAQNLCYTP